MNRSGSWLFTLRRAASASARHGLELLFPPECVDCGTPLGGRLDLPETTGVDLYLCISCWTGITADLQVARCRHCGTPLQPAPVPELSTVCADCLKQRPRFETVLTLGTYDGTLRQAILRAKKRTQLPLTRTLAEVLWLNRRRELQAWRPEVVVPVPMYWSRRWLRGVNSPDELARCLGRHLQLPVLPRLLRRRRNTQQQGELLPTARKRNVRDAFVAKATYVLNGARVLLVDDILTTGATCAEATRMLKHHGASAVAVATLARADRRH